MASNWRGSPRAVWQPSLHAATIVWLVRAERYTGFYILPSGFQTFAPPRRARAGADEAGNIRGLTPPARWLESSQEFGRKCSAGACRCQPACIQLCIIATPLCAGSWAGAGGLIFSNSVAVDSPECVFVAGRDWNASQRPTRGFENQADVMNQKWNRESDLRRRESTQHAF